MEEEPEGGTRWGTKIYMSERWSKRRSQEEEQPESGTRRKNCTEESVGRVRN